jgi:hypothetical protein
MEAMFAQSKMQAGAMDQMQNNPEMMTQAMEEVCAPASASLGIAFGCRVVRRSARRSRLFSPCAADVRGGRS